MLAVIIYYMNKLLWSLFFLSFSVWAENNPGLITNGDTPLMSTEVVDDYRIIDHKKSHWLSSFGFETLKYETFNDFEGVKKNFDPTEQELWGGRIGFGREIYLGAGFLTTTKMEGYYLGTLFSRELNGGAEDDDIKFAFTKRTGQIYGLDISQSLSFLFHMKTKNPMMDEWTFLTVEPFVEFGVGRATALNRLNYSYDLATTDEAYRLKVEDQLLNSILAVGVNFTSRSGSFLYLKAVQNRFTVTDRKATQLTRVNGGADVSSNPDLGDNMDMITTYAMGGGYKF